ncbi:MAG TPA: M28 family peptidase [Blastocatellia bacterium]|nr:M28 family peptidase [Blastocatellia bacterium]
MRRTFLVSLLLSCAVAASQPPNFAQVNREKAKPTGAAAQGKQDKTKPAATPVPQVKQETAKPATVADQFGNVEAITAAQLKEWLYVVASDEMEGRDTPSRGLDLTAKFIADHLSQWGVKPGGDDGTYFQKFALTSRRVEPELTIASVNGQSFKLGEDFIAEPAQGQASGRIVYVGHGHMIRAKDIDAYQGIDVKGKIMLAVEGFPRGVSFQDIRGKKAGEDYDTPETYARAHGARGVIYIPSASTLTFWQNRHKFSLNPSRMRLERPRRGGANIPVIYASEKMVKAILGGEKLDYETIRKQASEGALGEGFDLSPGKQTSFNVNAKIDSATTQNVVGVIEGADPVLKKEYVAVGAHYDHVGMSRNDEGDRIFNGADDDGSGTVATLAIAQALAKSAARPKRSVILVWHAGEEKGLWGSEFFTDNPTVPIEQVVTQLNIDMIGRSKKEGDDNQANRDLTGPNELYVIGSKMMSTDLGNLSEEVNNSYLKLAFNYKYDDPTDSERFFYRSDHYNYAKKGVPIIFYFSGVHEDYHGLADTADKIDYHKMEKVARTVFAMMWKLANAPARPKVDKPLTPQVAN